jgi:hypothetical protein
MAEAVITPPIMLIILQLPVYDQHITFAYLQKMGRQNLNVTQHVQKY